MSGVEKILLAQMTEFRAGFVRDVQMVVDDQPDVRAACDGQNRLGHPADFVRRGFFGAELDQVRAAVAELLRKDFRRAAMEVGRVNKRVKPAVRERFHLAAALCERRICKLCDGHRPPLQKNHRVCSNASRQNQSLRAAIADQHILERRREHKTLQPFGPGEPPRKRGVATAGDLRTGFRPRKFPRDSMRPAVRWQVPPIRKPWTCHCR